MGLIVVISGFLPCTRAAGLIEGAAGHLSADAKWKHPRKRVEEDGAMERKRGDRRGGGWQDEAAPPDLERLNSWKRMKP